MSKRMKRFLIPTGIGFVLAVIFWVLNLTGGMDGFGSQCVPPSVDKVLNVVHYPSLILLYIVALLRIPPQGDAGFIWFAILPGFQWILIGTAVGTVRAWTTKDENHGNTKANPQSSSTPKDGE